MRARIRSRADGRLTRTVRNYDSMFRSKSNCTRLNSRIAEGNLQGLRRLDLRGNDSAAEAFVNHHSSLYGAGEPHPYEHVIRPTAQDAEPFFPASVFHLFRAFF